MPIGQWSTTAANNANAATSINWAEGQPPSSVNDSARQMMADVAAWYQSPEWLNYVLTPTYISGTQFSVAGNQTGIYTVGRRVRAFVTAGTIYGTVSASAFASVTTVTVTWDSGSLDSGVSEVDVGVLNPLHSSFPTGTSGSFSGISIVSSAAFSGIGFSVSGYSPVLSVSGSSQVTYITNGSNNAVNFQVDDLGNVVIRGNITSSSDERLKKNWRQVSDDFIERLASVKAGSYDRKDIKQRQIGVGAQSLQKALPEAVSEDFKGVLSVAYGQAAMVSVVALAQEILRLRERISALEAK